MIRIAGKIYRKPLFVFALQSEAKGFFTDLPVIFTGIGKVNAAYHLTKEISDNCPDIIINCGTAGSTLFMQGDVIVCTKFIQRDMEVSALGFNKFQTPFEDTPTVLENGVVLSGYPSGSCGSGDNFEQEHKNSEYNVIDMEAYALAKIALFENIPFLSIKYITDGANSEAAKDWQTALQLAPQKLRKALDQLLIA